MNELEQARQEIDRIDRDIVHALERRVRAVEKVAAYKIAHGLPVLDRTREQAVLKERERMLDDPSLKQDVSRLFELLMSMSRARQQALLDQNAERTAAADEHKGIAAFQGVPGANSHAALARFFDAGMETVNYDSFEEVFAAVAKGEAEYGVLPIENSFAGSVLSVYDLLNRYRLSIVGEQSLKIEHMLLGLRGAQLAQIRSVYSHEQALMQCADFFAEHPGIAQHAYFNTAGAAQFVARRNDPSLAAIASEYAAELYGLDIVERNIHASGENTTRFIVIARQPYCGEDADKASVSFVLEHKTGALAHVLSRFAAYGLNMVKIESRPIRNKNFEYIFDIDFEGDHIREKMDRVIRESRDLFAQFTLLGIYKK